MITLTYGVLPSREQFDVAFERTCMITHGGQRRFRFGNDPRVGTCALTAGELWRELESACAEEWASSGGPNDITGVGVNTAGQWCSDVLSILGFEWV